VIEPIEKEIERLADITRIDGGNFEEIGKKFLVQKVLVLELRKILSFILSS